MQSFKDFSAYKKISNLTRKQANTLFHTKVCKVIKKETTPPKPGSTKYSSIWFVKKETEAGAAYNEVVAQEFFRLLSPNHPKTRLVKMDETFESVASKGLSNMKLLSDLDEKTFLRNLKSGAVYGLGEVMVGALWLNEVDLKQGNIAILNNQQIIKIDGDYCFAQFKVEHKDGSFPITARDINDLPFIKDYIPYHWIDYFDAGKVQKDFAYLDKDMSNWPNFREEINRTLLKIISLPQHLIKDVIFHYVLSPEKYKYYRVTIERQEQLKNAALQNKSFCDYVKTDKAEMDLNKFLQSLEVFTLTGKTQLSMEKYGSEIQSYFAELKEQQALSLKRM